MKRLCLYHDSCADGFAAAWVVRRYWQERGELEDTEFRAAQIGAYLLLRVLPLVPWVVIDDLPLPIANLVQTVGTLGMTQADAERAKVILEGGN